MFPIHTTRPQRERLADRAESDPLLTALFVVPLLALVHPAAPALAVLLLCGRRLGRSTRAPTGHGRVRRPA
jgi:hypothetical protein